MATYEQLIEAARKADAAGDAAATKRFLELAKAAKAGPQTNLAEQVGTGTSEGIANMAGFPVDMVTKGLNLIPGVDIERPFGGSESIKAALDPFMSDADPQTAAQRIGRRVGQDVGAGAVAAPVAGIGSLGGLALNTASDAASGLAGGATAEVTDNPAIQMIASLLAGGGTVAAARAKRPSGAPTMDELKAAEGKAYAAIRDSDFRLTPRQAQELQGNVSAAMEDAGMYPPQHLGARGAVERFYEMPNRHPEGTPSLQDVEDVRQYVNQNVVPSNVAGEGRLGLTMKREIDDFLRKNVPEEANVAATAHELSRRRIASEEMASQFEKAGWRAASTGLGGNDINAIRQNIRRILEQKPHGYTEAERKAMLEIVNGTNATNTARFIGGLAPQRGAFGLAGSMAAGGAGLYTGNAAWAAPAGIGIVAQAIGEQLTKRQVNRLSEMIRAGKPIEKGLTDGERGVLAALLAIQGQRQLLEQQ